MLLKRGQLEVLEPVSLVYTGRKPAVEGVPAVLDHRDANETDLGRIAGGLR